MHVFVFVLEVLQNMFINTNVTIAVNPKYINISNPGPYEQKPEQEQSLNVLLCESFYACKECWDLRRLCHMLNKHKAFLLCVF